MDALYEELINKAHAVISIEPYSDYHITVQKRDEIFRLIKRIDPKFAGEMQTLPRYNFTQRWKRYVESQSTFFGYIRNQIQDHDQ